MKKLVDIFPHDKELSEKTYEDFKKKLDFSKLQVNVFESICYNLHELEIESGIPIFEFSDVGVSITYPFTESSGRFDVNPFEEYKNKILKSNYMEIINLIKENVNDDTSEKDLIDFITSVINTNKEKIIKEGKKYKDFSIKFFNDFEIFILIFEE